MTSFSEDFCFWILADFHLRPGHPFFLKQCYILAKVCQFADFLQILVHFLVGNAGWQTVHNHARNVRACQEISEELGFAKVERLEGQLRHVTLDQLEAQRVVHLAIKEALKAKADSPEKIEQRLKEKGIECRFKLEEGKLKYSGYCYQGVPIKGQDVGFTARQLQARLDKNLIKMEAEKGKPTESVGRRKMRW